MFYGGGPCLPDKSEHIFTNKREEKRASGDSAVRRGIAAKKDELVLVSQEREKGSGSTQQITSGQFLQVPGGLLNRHKSRKGCRPGDKERGRMRIGNLYKA